MADVPRKPVRSSHPPPVPSELPADLEPAWDDDTTPRFELDDPMSESAFDRVTAIPELPSELLAKQMMSEPQDSAPYHPQPPRLDSDPPLISVRALDPMDVPLAPSAPGGALPFAPSEPGSGLITVQPPPPGRSEPTGLELMELGSGPSTTRSPSAAQPSRDPRDPVLELDLDLSDVARSGPPPELLVPTAPGSGRDVEIREMKDRYAMGDFTGALAVADGMLERDADDIDAQRYAQSCRDVLTQMYSARLGALSQHVRVAVPGDEIRWLSLDHRAGFVLSLIDGSSTVEELLDISGMNRLDALRIIYTLFDQRVIALS
jgi:hypothetical protein